MLKAIVSYSKKIPVPNAEYSSQGYSLSLETEITATDAALIQSQLHSTFELVKASVETELANGHVEVTPGVPPEAPEKKPAPQGKASNKQLKFVTDLATQQGLTLAQLNAGIQKRFGVDTLYLLDRTQASALLDELKSRMKQAA